MIGRDHRHRAISHMPPELLHLGARPDRRIDLGLAAEPPHVVFFIEGQVVDAALDRRGVPLRAVGGGNLVAAAERAVHHMRRASGGSPGLVDLVGGKQFRQRRARQPMGAVVGNPGRLDLVDRRAHRLVVLVVHAGSEPAQCDRAEAVFKERCRNARKALGIGAEGRELEGGDTRLHHFADARRPLLWVNGAIKREVDARLRTGMVDLAA
ncbi:hypothetical protein D9M72_501810 [compost metagenome]